MMNTTVSAFVIRGATGMGHISLLGRGDQVAVFKDTLTADDFANMRAGT